MLGKSLYFQKPPLCGPAHKNSLIFSPSYISLMIMRSVALQHISIYITRQKFMKETGKGPQIFSTIPINKKHLNFYESKNCICQKFESLLTLCLLELSVDNLCK